MNKKEILIICLIICCLFSLQAVAAASDGNSTDHVVLTTDSDVSAYSLPNTDNQLLDGSDAGTFSDLQDDLSLGGDIVLTKNYTYDSLNDSGLANGISVPTTVNSITGSGKIIIDGSQQARIFNIQSGHSVTLTGITFINANADGNGGSINSDGTLIISNCNFTNNTASGHGGAIYLGSGEGDTITNCNFEGNVAGGNGGAIDWYAGSSKGVITGSTFTDNTAKRSGGAVHWSGHYGTIRDSNFTDNIATGEVTSEIGGIVGGGDGGAVLWVGSNGTVDNCMFIGNVAQNRGGATFLHGNSTENCTNTTLSHSIFIKNTAGLNGGAVDWQEGAHDGKVVYCDFTNNTASSTGGAIYWSGHNGTIVNSNFTGNKALGTVNGTGSDGSNIPGGNGGAIVWKGAEGDIINSTFRLNNASRNGGAIFMQAGSTEDCSNITVDGSTFIENYAGVNGGALDWYEGAHDADLYNSVFINNTAERSGGAVYWFGHDGTIINSTFENNTAKGNVNATDSYGRVTPGGHGGAIMWTGANGRVLNSTFRLNNASRNGGAIYMQGSTDGDCSNITVDGSDFIENYAGINGGALDWYEGAHDSTLSNSYFFNNTAERSGGAVYWFGHDGTIFNSTFTNNTAKGNVLANDSYGRLTPGGHGGAIMWTGANGKILNSTFTLNNASRNGGAIYMQGSVDESGVTHDCNNITVDGSRFVENHAGINGGAVDWYEGAHDATLSNSVFNNNTAERSGGAVYWYGHRGTIRNSTFEDNQALGLVNAPSPYGYNTTGGDGGAVIWTGSDGLMDNCTFINNHAAKRGGAMYLQGGEFENCTNVTINNGIFKDNRAETNGGAVDFHEGATDGFIIGSTFDNNTAATGNGGSIFWNGNNGQVINSSFSNNHARYDGGAVYIEGNDCLLTNSTFDNNTAGDDGGAIFWTGQRGKMYNITANNNSGISKNDALDESHSKGGTIIITGSNMAIDQLVITNSFANEEAGGLFLTGNNVNLTNIYFSNCSASIDGSAQNNTKGGAMEIIGNNTRIINAVVEDSLAIDGGGIFWSGNDGYVYNLTAINNEAIEDGAALYISGDNCKILASNFTDNVAGDDGGAIYWEGNNGTLDGSSFVHNIGTSTGDPSDPSTSKGGTLSITGNNVDISNSNFSDSSTKNRGNDNTGGAIFITGNDVDIDGCNFNNCTAEGADGGTIYIIGDRTVVKNSNITDSTARAGGAIYIQGVYASIVNSSVTNTSAKNGNSYTTANLGGAIYVEGNHATIEGCEFDNSSAYDGGIIYLEGNYCNVNGSSFTDGYAYQNGGALYSTGSHSMVTNSNFTDNLVRLNGGALYWYGGSNSRNNTVDECIFTNNTAYGYTSNADLTRGGGAIYWSEGGTLGSVTNSKFYNNSVQSINNKKVDGGAILWDKSTYALVENCSFIGNFVTTDGDGGGTGASAVWAQGGAMYLRPNGNYVIRNCLFENCSSSKEAGALYIQSNRNYGGPMVLIENSTFINNVAYGRGTGNINGGGAIQVKQANHVEFYNVTFINNTANKGGALCVYDSVTTFTVDGANFTGNKAEKGSAISASVFFTLKDAVLLNNTADTTKFDLTFNRNAGSIHIELEGADTHLNAMYIKGGKTFNVNCDNVTYWTDNNLTIGKTAVQTGDLTSVNVGSVPEKGIAVLVEIFDGDNNKLHEGVYATDADGIIDLNVADILTVPYSLDDIYVNARIPNEDYYTPAEATSRIKDVNIDASALDTIFHRNTTVTANLTGPSGNILQSARGIISVYIDDVFKGNMTIENGKGSLENILTNVTADTFFEVGNHTVFLKYWGDAYYDEANTTVSLNITKAQSNLTVTIDDMGYNLYMNFTIFDDWDDKAYWDANGTATVDFYSEGDMTVAVRSVNVNVVNGSANVVVRDLLPRNYTIITTYHDDNNYNSSVNITNYTLNQKEFAAVFIEVNAYDIMVNDTVYINVTIVPPEGYDVPGNVTLYLDNVGYNLTLTMGATNATAKFNKTNLTEGIKKVIVFYEGSKLLGPAKGEADFRVHKYNTTLSANVTNITVIQNEMINITLSNDTTGIVSAIVDGKEYFGRIKNGTVSIELPKLPVGKYNVTLFYEGDNKYHNATNYTVFYVIQATPEIIIDVDNVTYGNETVIAVALPEDATGNVTVKINDTYYVFDVQNLTDGKAILPGVVLPAGNYTVEVTYSGDGNYTSRTNSTKFTVYKAKPDLYLAAKVLDLTVENIYYGENINVTVTVPDGVTGEITLRINGTDKNITLPIVDGKVNWTVGGLAVGNYVIIANYSGNENYTNATVTSGVNVLPIGTVLDVDVHDVPVWDTEYINITIKDAAGNVMTNATGNVTIDINGVEYTAEIRDGVARFNTSNLTVGRKVAWVFYDGDRNLTGSRLKAEFNVTQRVPKVNVTALNITVGQDGKITINIPANATGHVILSGNFTNNPIYVSDFTNGVAEITVGNLAVGNYSVHIKYIGDSLDNYTVAENDTTFKVDTINTTIDIDVESIDYGNKANITVTVNNNATGYITIRINETRNITLPIANGKVNWIVEDLAAGNYTVYANYSGDDKYTGNKTNKTFEVRQISPNVEIIHVDSTAGENATIIVRVDPRVTENVTIEVGGKQYSMDVDEHGIAIFTTDVLENGTYTIVASYPGDRNFTVNSTDYTFTANRTSDYIMNITASDIYVGNNTNITVYVPGDATGKVIIELNGTNYTAIISQGKAVLNNVSTLEEGVYNVTAYFGNDKYANKTVQTRFTVSKVDTPITITVVNDTSIYVNDTVKVVVTVPSDVTENVTIEINGMEFTNSTVNGNATFYIPQITYGNKTVVATYPGDDKYRFNSTTANFTVNKRQSQVNVTVDAGLVGDDVVINVTIPANATGYVIVSVDGTNYTVNTTNGNGSVSIKGLGNTTHTVHVTYIGDDQYLPSENSTTFGIPKDNTTISIAVESIDYGQKANITVTVKDDATGYITIKINDTHEITLPVVNGTVNWIVDGLAADNYTVYANYSGDGKYNVNATDKDFEVRQISPEIKIIRVISTAGENATIIVEIDPRTTENITVHVDKDYSVKPVNGIAVVTTDVLDYGNYTVNASYAGDKNFTKDYDIYKFTTNQTDDYLINITASDIEVGDNTNITVNVPSDATGKVIIELNGTNYTVTIADGKAVLNNVSTLEEGVYNVTAYFGDDKYANKTVETRFVVSKVDTPITITVVNDTSILVNDTVKVVVTVPSDVTENVTIEIDGMEFTNSTVNGNATFYIPQITYGNKTVVATYPGDDKYRFNSTTANFTVNKRDSFINVNATDGVVDGEVIINVTVPENAIGYVVVNVNGTNYTINLTNGDDRVVVKVTEAGIYNVTVTYIGDDQFLPSNNTTSFKVDKLPSFINATVNDNGIIANGSDVYINITAPEDITGNVTVIVWNKNKDVNTTYDNVYVNGGKGQLHIAAPAIGNYSVTVRYLENRKYLANENYTSFEVYDTIKELTVVPQNITFGSDEDVNVLLSGNHTGDTLTIIITNASGEVIRNESVKIDKYLDNFNISLAAWELKLDAGKYNATAIYVDADGAKVYTYKGSDSFEVYKAASTITIKEIRNVTVGDNVTIELEVSPNTATGNISVFVNGVEYKTTTDNPTITVSNLRADNYTVEAFYHGNKNYNESNATSSFRVDKLTVPLSIDVENMGDVVQINVTVGNNATGEILLDIEDNHYYANITNGVAQFNITGLKAGKHNVTARYVENDKYYGNTTKSSFTISKYQPEFTINGTDIDFGNAELITIETKDNITSLVEVEVNGRNYTTFIKNGKGNLTLNDLAAGDYNITLYFPANDKYEAATANGSFKVSQITPDINVVVQNITYGEVETITVHVNAEGNVTIEVGGYEFIEKPLTNGLVTVEVPYLNANNYTVNVTYNGNANYTRSNAKANFTVAKADPIITIDVKDIFYGDVEHIIVHVNAEGNVTVIVDNKTAEEISLENGEVTLRASRWDVPDYKGNATVNVEGLDAGHYPVVVIFNGNENYNKATATVDFEVYKVNTTVSVDVQPTMKIGESQVINITVNNTNATGNVIVIVDGVNNTVPVTNGTANFTIDATTAGNHTIVVIYEGDNNLNGNWTSAPFEVTKLDAPINMTISNSTVGGKQTITVEVPANATGQVLIDINGQPYYANVSDGKAILEIDTLPAGEYDVVATYLGDDTYLRNSTSDKFNVSKNNSTLVITPQNITCGESETITFTVPEDATGNITVVVNNETHTVPVSGGTGTLTIPKLPAGNYTINATYNGDGKYKPVTSSAEFEVSKTNDTDIKVIDQGNGTVVVVVGDNATGNITIKVGDNNYTAEIINGTAVIDLVNETPGVHDIEVIYSGDDNHEPSTTTGTVTIPKLETPISVDVNDTNVGDVAKIIVNVPDDAKGNVTIEINGVKYTEEIKDGKATFNVENLTAGTKTIAVDYVGDNNYTGNHTTANFTVNKVAPEITVNATNVTVGDKTLIEVTAPSDVTRPVLVDVDGVGYYVNLTNGKGSIEVPVSKDGIHDVSVTYLGDDKYTNASANTTFKASKVSDSSINVTVENITVGENAVIEVSVPKDATGNVTITVGGEDYVVPVADGKATLVVPGLEAGNYTVDVVYNGDNKYEPSTNSTKLEVSKVKSDDIKIIDQNNGTITIVVGDNATGNVTVKVGNETYIAEVVNGTAVITLENNTPGTYDVEVIYSGDDTHTGGNATSKTTIPKLETPISVEVSDIKVGDTSEIVVTVPDDAKGNVTIEIDGVKYTEEIKDGKATFNVENLTAGTKTVYVDYIGDNNYTGNHTSASFTVDKRKSTVEANTTPINVGETAVIEITVPDNATGYVIVEIANKTYAVEVENGKGTLEVEGLSSGTHDINVKYLGDDQYLPSNTTSTIEVSKVPSTINVTAENITVGDKAVINVEVPEDVCGNVTVSVDGKNYTVFVSGGKGTLVIPDLDVGDYTVDAIFAGCKKYEPSNATTKFTVSKIKTDDIKVIDQGNGTVVVVVGDNATGNVTIKVGDKEYNATVVNGTAVVQLDGNVTPGTHEVEVIYSGDDTHNGTSTLANITAPKYDAPIDVEVGEAKEGEPVVITVTVPDDATGNVTVSVGGKDYPAVIKDGKAVVTVDDLAPGDHTIAVVYDGDDNYNSNYTIGNLTVEKAKEVPDMKVIDQGNGTVVVVVGDNATGNVTIKVGNETYTAEVVNGTAVVQLDGNVTPGTHEVEVIYSGDDTHEASNTTAEITAPKYDAPIDVEVGEAKEGEPVVITVTVPDDATGNVTVSVGGKDYPAVIKDGKAVVTVDSLPAGDHTIAVVYDGDDNYNSNYTIGNLTVEKAKEVPDMKVIDQGNGTVVVVVGDNATGNVTIKVGNETYTAEVVNGTAVITLDNNTPGTYDVEVIYSGDDTHESQVEDSKVTIPKYNTPISVDVDDCYVGDTAVVTVTLPDDATGTVTIEINGKTYTAEAKDGKAVFNVDGLEAGDKTVAVKYDGDKNYVENSTTGQFTVSKRPSTVSASGKDIKVGNDEVITVTVPSDATGRVLVDIDGVGYYGTVINGMAKVIIPELPSGEYTATVTYEGDGKYLPNTTTTQFTVTKVSTPISATGDEIYQGEDASVVVNLPSDATGTVTITVDGKNYTEEVKDGKAVFVIPGLTKGDHEVTASYSGDKKYEANDTITDIEVICKDSPSPSPEGGDDVKPGEGVADLTKHATGNPILMLLLIILTVGSTQIRRFRK